jgi:selenide,water dikinase
MTRLNADASRELLDADAHAVTDVTGFGLLGHLQRMTVASGVHAEIDPDAVPLLPSVAELQAEGFVPGGTLANLDFLRPHLRGVPDDATLTLLADAQTSGGLLAALDRDAAEDVARSLRDQGHRASVIGTIGTGEPGTVSFA